MMDKLTAKVGPLPAYMWGLILGGLFLGYMWWSRSKSNAAGAAQVVTTTGTPFDVPSTGLSPAGGGTATTDTSSGSQWGTNALWEASALASLSGSGVSPLAAQIALEKYLNGQSLTAADQQIVNLALQKQGAPPNGLTGPPTLDPVIVTPAPSGGGTTVVPTHGSTYIVRPGDNWLTIASRYGISESALLAQNTDNPAHKAYGGALGVGESVWLPAGSQPVSTPITPPKPAPPKRRVVVVNKGDNWNTVAARLGVTEPALRGANPSLPGTLHTGSYTFIVP